MNKKQFLNYFLNVPISINNLYGDPFFKTQRENTFRKLNNLINTGHKGIVSIITKSEINEDDVKRLKLIKDKLNLIVLVSCSELPYSIEKVPGNRYKTLQRCIESNIPAIAYVRPFIPKYNTCEKIIRNMLKKISETKCKRIVVSGLRGTDDVLLNSEISKEEIENWSLRVKIMPLDVGKYIEKYSNEYGLKVYKRTSCGVSAELNMKYSYNPYYHSPQLAGCEECELKRTCFDKQKEFYPTKEDLDFIKILGYDAQIVNVNNFDLCNVDPQKRTECLSCCTACFVLKRYAIELFDKDICLGDLGLLRLLVKKLVFKKETIDVGEKDIAIPQKSSLQNLNLYTLNSWWSYSRNISNCYNCSYCIVKHYNDGKKEGFSEECGDIPLNIGNKIWNRYMERSN